MLTTAPSDNAMDVSPEHPQQQHEESSSQEQTQEATQQTEEGDGSYRPAPECWAYLAPINAALNKITFAYATPNITIGRNKEKNLVVLPGMKISNVHCEIRWDQRAVEDATVVLLDKSTNGTFINGERVPRGTTRLLKSGNEIAFGTAVPQLEDPKVDYRFIYHFSACGPPKVGLHSQYDMAHTLGSGAFATVMKGMCRKSGNWYAIKIIHDKAAAAVNGTTSSIMTSKMEKSKEEKRKTLAREIGIMHKLHHPNICELKEVFIELNRDICLVLEFVNGGDLLDYIMSRERLDEQTSLHFTYQICDALQYTHSLGVAHRDLKPENILLTQDNPPRVKIGDFGLAKSIDSMTMLKTMCGTPAYIAPEVVTQSIFKPGYTLAVDAWSVGVIAYSMVTGASSFIEDDNPDIRIRVRERKVDWHTLASVHVSQHCTDFIRELFQVNPELRMTMKQALQHPWIASYIPVYDNQDWYLSRQNNPREPLPEIVHDLTSTIFNPDDMTAADHVMAEAPPQTTVSQDLNDLHLNFPSVPTEPAPQSIPPHQTPSIPSQQPKSAPRQLVRRSIVMAEANEGNGAVFTPPPELIAYLEARERDAHGHGPMQGVQDTIDGAESSAPNANHWTAEDPESKKRGRELSDVAEEQGAEIEGENGAAAELDDDHAPVKKGRGTGAKRGRAKAVVDPTVPPRRSSRTTPKKR